MPLITRAPVMFFLACLLLAPGLSRAGEIVVGVEDLYYRPFYYLETGQYRGAARDVLDAFANKNGLSIKYEPRPVNRLYKEFLNGEIDFKFPDNPHWKPELKRDRKLFYSRPVLGFIDGVMVRPERRGAGVKGIKILGTVLGFTPWNYQKLIKAGNIRLMENASFSGLLEQVILGRIDGAYMNPVVARYQLSQVMKKPGALVFDPGLPHIEDAYRLSSLKDPGLIKRFNRFLATEVELIKAIKKRHKVVF